MKTWRWVCYIVLYLFLFVVFVGAIIQWSGTQYLVEQESVKVQWDAVLEAIGYEVQIVQIFPKPETILKQISTENTSIELFKPKVGFFEIKCRAWRWDPLDPTQKQYSAWAFSRNPEHATVDGRPEGWWIFWAVEIPMPY